MALVGLRVECRGRVELHEVERSELEIGRNPACDLVIDHASVAPRHARLLLRRGRLILADLGRAKTGTTRGRQRVLAPVLIEPGERFRVGEVSIAASPRVEEERGFQGRTIGGARVLAEVESADRSLRRYRTTSEAEGGIFGEIAVVEVGHLHGPDPALWLEHVRGSARTSSPSVPRALDSGEIDRRPYLIEAVPSGIRLSAVLDGVSRGALHVPLEAALVIVALVAESVAAMRRVWGPHGAIEPRRVQLGLDGTVLLLRPGPTLRLDDSVTDEFLAPERRYSLEPTGAGDAYALGALGKAVLWSRADCPPRVRAICCWLAHVEPARRPHDLEEVAGELRRASEAYDPTFGHVARVARLLSPSLSRRLSTVPGAPRVSSAPAAAEPHQGVKA